jgi:peptidyl-prolyl cis-trans isomerase SurA
MHSAFLLITQLSIFKTAPHIENLKDDYSKIAQRLITKKKNEMLTQWFRNYMFQHNITIASEYQACR